MVVTDFRPVFDGRSIPEMACESLWKARDGQLSRRIDWLHPQGVSVRGSILFAPGRGDCYEKHLQVLEYWFQQGWNVSSFDWRGQGLSGRLGLDRVTGHVENFDIWLADLALFWSKWVEAMPGPHVCVGHSMGGHLLLRAAIERIVVPDALVLVAPMLGLNPGWVPSRLLFALGRVITSLGDNRRPAWKVSELPLSLAKARMQLLTHDEIAYANEGYWYEKRPELIVGPPSWGWVMAALTSIRALEQRGLLEAVQVPTLLLGTRADRLVSWRAIKRAARRLPNAELVAFGTEARHEILREVTPVRDRALLAITQFLERTAPQGPSR